MLRDGQGAVRLEAVEPAVVDLGLQEDAAVLHAGVEREDPVVHRVHGDARRQRARVEDIDAVGEPDGGVVGRPSVALVKRCSGLRVVEKPKRVATFSCISQSP